MLREIPPEGVILCDSYKCLDPAYYTLTVTRRSDGAVMATFDLCEKHYDERDITRR